MRRAALAALLLVPVAAAPPGEADLRSAGHLLRRAAYGPSRADLQRVLQGGLDPWIDEQIDPERIDDAAVEALVEPLFEMQHGRRRIKGLAELKTLAHLYAVHSRRQLREVLAGFWENHFSTDANKVAEHLDKLQNSDASDALSKADAAREAAHLEHQEFEFFRRRALGSFEELLRFSARSPAMLIYLDSVLNVKGRPNENYAREILELHALGVDNGYVQKDIEQLAKCLTGWGVAKVAPEHAGDPHAPTGVKVADRSLAAAAEPGEGSDRDWRYLKGREAPPADWTLPGFDDSGWLRGPASIGYGDNDDLTDLKDMAGNYSTVFLRKAFTLADPASLREHLLFTVDVDDGFVAYLNGAEVARLNAPGKPGTPVAFDAVATMGHEADGLPLQFNLNRFKDKLVAGRNVLALVALNVSKASSDLTLRPSLLDRNVLPGSLETGDPRGAFAFHYFPDLHDGANRKQLFAKTPQALEVDPRTGGDGLGEAEAAIRRILDHPSTATFVCVKLIRKLVGDDVDFRRPGEGPYAGLLRRCVEAWNASTPRGSIRDVVRTILTSSEFRSERAMNSKVKDAFEFVNGTVRALEVKTSGRSLPDLMRGMGMELFTRKEPDGWPELGGKLLEMGSFQKRVAFALALAEGTPKTLPDLQFDPLALLEEADLGGPERIAAGLNRVLFQGALTPAQERRLARFLGSGEDGRPLPLNRDTPDFLPRLRRGFALALSLPAWQYQ